MNMVWRSSESFRYALGGLVGLCAVAGSLGCSRCSEEPKPGPKTDRGEPRTLEVGDALVTARVRTRLYAALEDASLGIQVETRDGTVTLKGVVERPEHVVRAAEAARAVAGVRAVDVRITPKDEASGVGAGEKQGAGNPPGRAKN